MAKPIHKSFVFNLFLVIAICFALYFLFFISLGFITHHGSESLVPKLINRDVRVAVEELEGEGYDIQIDSTYDPKKKPYVVISQQPEVGQKVKRGRTIFLTVNKAQPPFVAMPSLTGLSFRSAEMILKSNQLRLGDTIHRPDIAKGAVLEQTLKGSPILAGTLIPQGTKVDLIIGEGLGNIEFTVPDILGMSVTEAIAMLSANNLLYTAIADGAITDTASAVVYFQIPNSKNELGLSNGIREGDVVDFRYKQIVSPGELDSNRNPYKFVLPIEEQTTTTTTTTTIAPSTIDGKKKPLEDKRDKQPEGKTKPGDKKPPTKGKYELPER